MQENKNKDIWEKEFDKLFHGNIWIHPFEENGSLPPRLVLPAIKKFIKDDFIPKSELKEVLEEIRNKKFPIGERKWCIECATRIKKDIKDKFNL